MNRTCRLTVLIALMFISFKSASSASADDEYNVLKIRSGLHSEYYRIVIEGPDSIISNANVEHNETDIMVRFGDSGYSVEETGNLPFKFKKDNDVLMFSPQSFSSIKTFSLKNPDRIVIDVYKNSINKSRKENNKSKPAQDVKPEAVINEPVAEKPEVPQKNTAADEKNIAKKDKNKTGSFITADMRKYWETVESGKAYEAIKELALVKPDNPESLAVYHFIHGEAYNSLDRNLDAVNHYRLAYIYSTSNELRETALLRRAKTYLGLGLLYEARADFLMFIKEFPFSVYSEEANLSMAKTLAGIGDYTEALEHYEKSGSGPDVLFGRANTLQRLGSTEKAKSAYAEALAADRDYLDKSLESTYLIGENMRMIGEVSDAKKYFQKVQTGLFSDRSQIGLGMIAMGESRNDEAVRKFKAAAESKDRRIRAEALYNLSKAQIASGDAKAAVSSLEEIRARHNDSSFYKMSVLELSRLYRNEGQYKKGVSLLKELVYGDQAPAEAFSELETLLLEAGEKTGQDGETLLFVELWRDVGQWMLDESREEFLLKMLERLRNEGRPFLRLSEWLVNNSSKKVKAKAAASLSDYYMGIGQKDNASEYLNIAMLEGWEDDNVFRVNAGIQQSEGDSGSALKNIQRINKFEKNDFLLLAKIIKEFERSGSKDNSQAISLYEEKLSSAEWNHEIYAVLADFHYQNGNREKAMKYYREAYEKNPRNEWAAYRIGNNAGGQESREVYSLLQKEDTVLGRLSRTKMIELSLKEKVSEVY